MPLIFGQKPEYFIKQRHQQAPTITVMMPAYNAARYLAKALQSVFSQDCGDFEIVLVDDGSTDQTYEVAKRFCKDPRLRLYKNRVRRGIVATRNKILSLARGSWVVAHDADDIMLPGRLRNQLEICKRKPTAGGVFGLGIVMRKKTNWDIFGCRGVNESGWLKEGFIKTMPHDFHHGTSMVKKKLIIKAGGYDALISQGEDLRLFRKLFRMAPFYFINKFCMVYRKHPNSASSVYVKQRARFLKSIFAASADKRNWLINFNNIVMPLRQCDAKSQKQLLWRFNLYAAKSRRKSFGNLAHGNMADGFLRVLGKRLVNKKCILIKAALLSKNGDGILIFFKTKAAENGLALLSYLNKGYVYHCSETAVLDFSGKKLESKESIDPLVVNLPKDLKIKGLFQNPILKKSYLAMDLFRVGAIGGGCRISRIVVLKIKKRRARKRSNPLSPQRRDALIAQNLLCPGLEAPTFTKLMRIINKIPAYEINLNSRQLKECSSFGIEMCHKNIGALRDLL